MSDAPRDNADSGSFEIPNTPGAIERAQDAVLDAVQRHGYPKASVFAIRLSLHEAITNAFAHGHKRLPPEAPVRVVYKVSDAEVRMSVEDQGPGFRPGDVPDPTLETNLEEPHGRGLVLMRAYMTSVEYNTRGNRVDMTYRKPAGA